MDSREPNMSAMLSCRSAVAVVGGTWLRTGKLASMRRPTERFDPFVTYAYHLRSESASISCASGSSAVSHLAAASVV